MDEKMVLLKLETLDVDLSGINVLMLKQVCQ